VSAPVRERLNANSILSAIQREFIGYDWRIA
jgi:hypothetical protein